MKKPPVVGRHTPLFLLVNVIARRRDSTLQYEIVLEWLQPVTAQAIIEAGSDQELTVIYAPYVRFRRAKPVFNYFTYVWQCIQL
ncbi:hypothetical protein [Oceanimonas baumannii]|uniref:Uncharacterized protein n=1 Tax=Oceanimonas baumannii TaxID=129578 RepID=A0A235CA40_9GAMM|nr:hypothetical protein [Oceanimonas baumannii]OYD21304.1 hypothetical protein B6S09_16120 [Oceanimonas baumannii]